MQQVFTDHTSVWLLGGAALIGFAVAWLAFEVRRAWGPDALRDEAEDSRHAEDIEVLARSISALVEQIADVRREIAEVRESDARHVLARLERLPAPRATHPAPRETRPSR